MAIGPSSAKRVVRVDSGTGNAEAAEVPDVGDVLVGNKRRRKGMAASSKDECFVTR